MLFYETSYSAEFKVVLSLSLSLSPVAGKEEVPCWPPPLPQSSSSSSSSSSPPIPPHVLMSQWPLTPWCGGGRSMATLSPTWCWRRGISMWAGWTTCTSWPLTWRWCHTWGPALTWTPQTASPRSSHRTAPRPRPLTTTTNCCWWRRGRGRG